MGEHGKEVIKVVKRINITNTFFFFVQFELSSQQYKIKQCRQR